MSKSKYRLIFMGTPEISAYVFEQLILEGYHFVGLIAQVDQLIGRKKIKTKVPTKVVAEKYNIPVFQPEKIRLNYEFVKDLAPDLILTFAYGQIIPQGLLDIPKFGCLNIHGSLLPKYRGAAPIQRAIMAGEKETGLTLMEMIDKMDAGKMYAKSKVLIEDDDNFSSLAKKMMEAAFILVRDNLPLYFANKLIGEEQNELEVTFANKIKDEDEKIPLDLTKEEIVNYIRALSNEPGAYLNFGENKLKIYAAKILNDLVSGEVGEIVSLKEGVVIQTKNGQISLLEVQLAGHKSLKARDFINGQKNLLGQVLT